MTIANKAPESRALIESTRVQLTRIEGVLNLVLDKVSGLTARVDRHDAEIDTLKSSTQTLREQAVAGAEKAVALATALKEADESRRNKDSQVWSPFQKMLAVIAALAATAGVIVFYIK